VAYSFVGQILQVQTFRYINCPFTDVYCNLIYIPLLSTYSPLKNPAFYGGEYHEEIIVSLRSVIVGG